MSHIHNSSYMKNKTSKTLCENNRELGPTVRKHQFGVIKIIIIYSVPFYSLVGVVYCNIVPTVT